MQLQSEVMRRQTRNSMSSSKKMYPCLGGGLLRNASTVNSQRCPTFGCLVSVYSIRKVVYAVGDSRRLTDSPCGGVRVTVGEHLQIIIHRCSHSINNPRKSKRNDDWSAVKDIDSEIRIDGSPLSENFLFVILCFIYLFLYVDIQQSVYNRGNCGKEWY